MHVGPCYKLNLTSMTYISMISIMRASFYSFVCLVLLTSGGAGAQPGIGGDAIFTVRDVSIDVTASTAMRARDVAIRRAQRKAARTVFDRITLPEDKRKLPVLDDLRIARLVSSIDLSEERYSSRRYLATITITFNRKSILDLMRALDISFSQTQARPIVVVPIFREGATAMLWEAGNPWRAAWRSHDWCGNLLSFVVPIGSLSDVAAISVRQATSQVPDRIFAIAEKYGAEETIVADATMHHSAVDQPESLDVTITSHSGEQTLNVTFVRDETKGRDEFLAWCVTEITDRLTLEWKRQTLIESDEEKILRARAPLDSLRDWLALQAVLGEIGRVNGFVLDSLSVDEAALTIEFLGSPEQLATALEHRGGTLAFVNGEWILSIE